jgi:hypothetical protein
LGCLLKSLGVPTHSDTPPAPQARDVLDGKRCVQSNRRPRNDADEPRDDTSVCENRARNALIQQHRRPGHGAFGPSLREPSPPELLVRRAIGGDLHDVRVVLSQPRIDAHGVRF